MHAYLTQILFTLLYIRSSHINSVPGTELPDWAPSLLRPIQEILMSMTAQAFHGPLPSMGGVALSASLLGIFDTCTYFPAGLSHGKAGGAATVTSEMGRF
jgi:hypothetical protein